MDAENYQTNPISSNYRHCNKLPPASRASGSIIADGGEIPGPPGWQMIEGGEEINWRRLSLKTGHTRIEGGDCCWGLEGPIRPASLPSYRIVAAARLFSGNAVHN